MILLLGPNYWIGIWPETGAAAQVPAFFLSIIAAGAAAWSSGSKKRHNLEEQMAAAAIPAAKSEAYQLGTSMIILVIPYLIGHAVAFALTARTFPAGIQLWLGYALMGTVVMLLAIAWGWAIGRYLSPVYAALVALLSWFVFEVFPGDTADLGVLSGPVWQQPDTRTMLIRFVAVAVFSTVIVWAPPLRTQWKANWERLIFPMVAAAVAIVATVGTAGISDRDAPRNPLCVAGKVEMCLWPENVKYIPMIHSVDARVSTLPASFQLPLRLYEYGLKRRQISYAGETVTQLEGDFDISEGSKWGLALGVSDAIISETLKSCDWDAIRRADDFTPEAVRRWVEFYLTESSTPDYRTSGVPQGIEEAWSAASKVFTELPPQKQREWVQEQLNRLKASHCG